MTYDPGGLEYRPIRRTNNSGLSPIRRMMAISNEALVDQARIAAETASEHFQAEQRINSGYNLAMLLAVRSGELQRVLQETGNVELRQLHAFVLGAATEAIVDLIKGHD